jgi:hypothetical protein
VSYEKRLFDVSVFQGAMAVSYSDSISLFSTDGILRKKWPTDWESDVLCYADSNKIIAAYIVPRKVVMFDTSGNKTGEIFFSEDIFINGIAFDTKNKLLYVAGAGTYRLNQRLNDHTGVVRVFDINAHEIANYWINNLSTGFSNGSVIIRLMNDGSPLIAEYDASCKIVKLKPLVR